MVRVAQYSWYDFYEFLYVDVLAGKLFFSFQFWREYAWVVVGGAPPGESGGSAGG